MYYDIEPITSPKPNDCGPTCLKMLLAYYGKDVPLDTLVEECSCTIIGVTAKELLRVGRLHGLDLKAYQTDVDGVADADRPSIVWWKRRHFVVCCGTDEAGQVVVCDPDKGRYRMSKGIFRMFYSKTAIFAGEPADA